MPRYSGGRVYTGAASVQAACGGALETLSLDLSARYCDWAIRNLARNGFGAPQHRCRQVDCVHWLTRRGDGDR